MNNKVRPAFYHALVPLHRAMSFHCRAFRKVANVSSIGALLAFVAYLVAYQPRWQPDHAGYSKCVRIHPERHCHTVFLEAR